MMLVMWKTHRTTSRLLMTMSALEMDQEVIELLHLVLGLKDEDLGLQRGDDERQMMVID